jgi:hypothetical protein
MSRGDWVRYHTHILSQSTKLKLDELRSTPDDIETPEVSVS